MALRDSRDRSGQGDWVHSEAVRTGDSLPDHHVVAFDSGRNGVPILHLKSEGAMTVRAPETKGNRFRCQAVHVSRRFVRTSALLVTRDGHF